MKNVLFIATGGTIASTPGEEGMAPTLEARDLVAAAPGIGKLCRIHTRMLMNIDSSNMQPEDWARIADCVFGELRNYDGFVVAHGTDTMAYTASALSFMLADLDRPVVLTGSQLSISADGNDAVRNVLDACAVAALAGKAEQRVIAECECASDDGKAGQHFRGLLDCVNHRRHPLRHRRRPRRTPLHTRGATTPSHLAEASLSDSSLCPPVRESAPRRRIGLSLIHISEPTRPY